MLIPGHREGIESDSFLRFHLVPQARTGQRRQKPHVNGIHPVPAGDIGDVYPDARMIYVQAHNEGTGDHYAVTLLCAARRRARPGP